MIVWFRFTELKAVGSTRPLNIVCQISGHSWKFQNYVNNLSRVNINASVHEFYIKAALTTAQIY